MGTRHWSMLLLGVLLLHSGRVDAQVVRRAAVRLSANVWSLSTPDFLIGLLYTILATCLLFVIIHLLLRFSRHITSWLCAQHGNRIRAIHFRGAEILSATQELEAIAEFARFLIYLLIIVILYCYLLLVFNFFPSTRRHAATLYTFVTTNLVHTWHAMVISLPNLLILLIIIVVTRFILKMITLFFRGEATGRITMPGFQREWSETTSLLIRLGVVLLAIILAFPFIPGTKSHIVQGVSLVVGILISLGSSSAISNMIAGIVLTYMSPYRVGDYIQVGDTVGDVTERSLLLTRVRTVKNVDVTIPNALILGQHINNFSSLAEARGLILHTSVTIGYDTPWRQVHALLLAAAHATPDILPDPSPFILQTALNNSNVSYELNAYTDQPNHMVNTYAALHEAIQQQFNLAGVEIMSPYFAAVRDGNTTTVPAENRPEKYTPPTYRVSVNEELGD